MLKSCMNMGQIKRRGRANRRDSLANAVKKTIGVLMARVKRKAETNLFCQ